MDESSPSRSSFMKGTDARSLFDDGIREVAAGGHGARVPFLVLICRPFVRRL